MTNRELDMSSEYNNDPQSISSPPRSPILYLLISSYAFIVFLHINLLLRYFHSGIGVYFSSDGPRTIGSFVGDEAVYRIYAESLLHFAAYPAPAAYPPAYPLVLALAELLSPADPIKAMIIANIAVASAVMFPAYALARQMLERDLAFGAAIVAGLLPASFIFAPAMMSENLFTTVFVTAAWLAVRQRPATLVTSGLFGATLVLGFLTKFLFLPMIPFLGTAFIINQLQMCAIPAGSMRRRVMVRLAVAAVIAGIIPVALWSVYLVASGRTVAQSLGYHVATIAFAGPKGWRLPPPALVLPILGLNGLAIAASALPVLPSLLTGIFGRRHKPLLLHVVLLGAMAAFMWLFVTVYGWFALLLLDYPQPIYQRYSMMLVPIFVTLAFVGLKQMLDWTAGRRSWRSLAVAGFLSLALAIAVQAGLYDRTIWPIPAWITVIWVGGPDVLYGALGFPVIVVTAVAVGVLVIVRLTSSIGPRLGLTGQRALRLGVITAATTSVAVFNVAAGMAGTHFAWDSPFLAINAAHARAITAIIGDRSRDRRPALVSVEPAVFDSIEKTSGVSFDEPSHWWMNLTFWSGRQAFVVEADSPLANRARYRVSLARPGADPATVYQVGAEIFQVQTVPDR